MTALADDRDGGPDGPSGSETTQGCQQRNVAGKRELSTTSANRPPFFPTTMTTRRYDQYGFPIPVTFEDDAPAPPNSLSARRRRALRALFTLSALGVLGILVLQTPLRQQASKLVSGWLLDRSMNKYAADDLPGALVDLDRAVAWSPDSPAVFALRAEVRLASNDLSGSLADCNKLISLSPHFARGYLRRAHVYQRLERHQEIFLVHILPQR